MNRLLVLLVFASATIFMSCAKEDEGATAEIKVLQNGTVKATETVYMFRDRKGPDTVFFTPFHANRQSITGADGIAVFELRNTFDLENIATQTTIYFGVFDGDNVLGYTALTIKKGETKMATINL